MPIIDMPLDELKKYQGCTPCSEDINAYMTYQFMGGL